MAAAAHPPKTPRRLGPWPAPPPPPPSCRPAAVVGSARLLGLGPARAEGPRRELAPRAGGRASRPGRRQPGRPREHLCTAILDSVPQSRPGRGGGGKGNGARGAPGSASAPEPERPAGRAPGEKDASGAGHRPAARLARRAPALHDTHTPPAALTTPRRATPAAAVAPEPRRTRGEAAIAPGRGAARARGAEDERREDGARSLLEHGLLLLLFFLLAIHDGQDDLPLLFREVAEVRHLGLRRRLRGRRGGHRAAPGPERSRHVGWSRTTLGKQGDNSAGSGGSGAGGSGSLRRWDQDIQINGLQSRATAPLPPRKGSGGRGGPRWSGG